MNSTAGGGIETADRNLGKPNRNNDLISIVATSSNHAEYLRHRMRSLLRQAYSPVEIIIVDDCLTDDSLRVLE